MNTLLKIDYINRLGKRANLQRHRHKETRTFRAQAKQPLAPDGPQLSGFWCGPGGFRGLALASGSVGVEAPGSGAHTCQDLGFTVFASKPVREEGVCGPGGLRAGLKRVL